MSQAPFTPKAILFDLEGTIIDTEPIWSEVDVEFLGRRGLYYDEEGLKHQLMGRSMEGVIELYRELYQLEGSLDELMTERRAVVRQLLEREIAFIPGFQDFFAHVRSRYATAIATSMERSFLTSVDQALSLTKLFDGHVYSIDDIGFIAKPNPDIFLHAAKALGVASKDCLVIEDAPNGVEAAHRAGMRVVALTTSTNRDRLAEADQIVDRYDQIKL